jgi:hypothetical protein
MAEGRKAAVLSILFIAPAFHSASACDSCTLTEADLPDVATAEPFEVEPGPDGAHWALDLDSNDPYRRAEALRRIAEARDHRFAGQIRSILASDDAPVVLCRALQALGRLGESRSIHAVEPLLDSPYRSVRAFSVWAVGELRAPESRSILLPLLRPETDPVLLGFAIDALAKVGGERDAPRLERFLRHDDPRIRSVAAKALGELGTDDTVGVLFAALDLEESVDVQRALTVAVGRIGGPFAVRQLELMLENPGSPERQRMALDGFRAMGLGGAEALRDELDRPQEESRLTGWIRAETRKTLAKIEDGGLLSSR